MYCSYKRDGFRKEALGCGIHFNRVIWPVFPAHDDYAFHAVKIPKMTNIYYILVILGTAGLLCKNLCGQIQAGKRFCTF